MDKLNILATLIGKGLTNAGKAGLGSVGAAAAGTGYLLAGDDEKKKERQAKKYTEMATMAQEALKEFGFDDSKKTDLSKGQVGSFNVGDYAKGTSAAAADAASLATPLKAVGATRKARILNSATQNAIISAGQSAGEIEGGDVQDWMKDPKQAAIDTVGEGGKFLARTGLGTIFGTGAEYGGKLVGKGLNKIGTGLKEKAKNAGKEVLGLSSLDTNEIEKRFRQPLDQILKKYNIFGKGVEGIEETIDPIQNEFDKIANNPDLKISTMGVLDKVESRINELRAKDNPEFHKIADGIESYFTNFVKNNPVTELGADVLTGKRIDTDMLVRDFKNDGLVRSSNNQIREILQDSIRDAADKAGIKTPSGKSLKDIGQDLNVLYTVLEKGKKRANKTKNLYKEVVGSGAGAIASMVGGIPGAIAGYAVGKQIPEILMSPGGVNASSNVQNATGDLLQNVSKNSEFVNKLFRNAGIESGNLATNVVDGLASGSVEQPNNTDSNSNENASTDSAKNFQSSNTTVNSSQNIPQPGQNANVNLDEVVTITNQQTGETKQVPRRDLGQYGLNPDKTPIEQPQQQNPGGMPFTSEQLMQGIIKAQLAGDVASVKEMGKVLETVVMYEEMEAKKVAAEAKTKPKTNQFVQSAETGINRMKQLYGFADDKGAPVEGAGLSAGDSTTGNLGLNSLISQGNVAMKKQDQGFKDKLETYNNFRAVVIPMLNQAIGAGTPQAGEMQNLIATMPNENSSTKEAQAWFENVQFLLEQAKNNPIPGQQTNYMDPQQFNQLQPGY